MQLRTRALRQKVGVPRGELVWPLWENYVILFYLIT